LEDNMSEQWLTVREVAETAKVGEETVRWWYRSGKLKGVKLGYRTLRFDPAEVRAFLARGVL
jgi:excisionase family DNA binding protein